MREQIAELEAELGRSIKEVEVKCPMCSGLGFSSYEDPCSACSGDGRVKELQFDCGHAVEDLDECRDAGCLCELMQDDQGARCNRPYAMTVHEPYTPASFGIRCCKECAESQIRFGYRRGEAA
jgi:hypothetical protein